MRTAWRRSASRRRPSLVTPSAVVRGWASRPAAYSFRPRAECVAPAGGPRQLMALTDTLARLSPYASGPFQTLLGGLPRWLPVQAQIVVITARDPIDQLPVLRRLRASGYELLVIGVGPEVPPSRPVPATPASAPWSRTSPPIGGRPMRSAPAGDAAPPVFGAIAEGAWIAVVAAAVVAPVGGPGPAGVRCCRRSAALLGMVAARLLPAGPGRAAALLGVAAAVVVAGFVAGRSLGLAAAGGPLPYALYPVLGFAVLRGAAQGDPSARSHAIDTLVRRSPALLGCAWVLGVAVAGEGRATFIASAASASLVFVVAAALGLGTARLASLPPETRDQLRGNGSWLAMVVVIVGAALAVAVPLSWVLGQPIGLLAGGIAGLVTAIVLGVAGAIMAVVVVVVDLVGGSFRGLLNLSTITTTQPPPERPPDRPVAPGGSEPSNPIVEPVIALLVLVAIVAIAWYLARRWQGARLRATSASGGGGAALDPCRPARCPAVRPRPPALARPPRAARCARCLSPPPGRVVRDAGARPRPRGDACRPCPTPARCGCRRSGAGPPRRRLPAGALRGRDAHARGAAPRRPPLAPPATTSGPGLTHARGRLTWDLPTSDRHRPPGPRPPR